MHRKSIIINLIMALTLAIAVLVWANIPAPPVNQIIGIDDSVFNNLAESDCRFCHEGNDPGINVEGRCSETGTLCFTDADCTGGTDLCVDVGIQDRHHILALTPEAIPIGLCSTEGTCSVSGDACIGDADCPAGETCVAGARGPCVTDDDCTTVTGNVCQITGEPCTTTADCPRPWTGQQCGQPVCQGGSVIQDPDTNNDGQNDTLYACESCHPDNPATPVIDFTITRDCTVCHVQTIDTPTVHHATSTAKGGDCVACHGTLVDNPTGCKDNTCSVSGTLCDTDADCPVGETCVLATVEGTCDDGHLIPTYEPSLVTPSPSLHGHECVDGATGIPVDPQVLCDVNTDCVAGTCSVAGTACHEDTECPVGETCDGGQFCDEIVPTVQLRGGCAYCHDAGTDTASGVLVVDNHDTHHGAGIHKNKLGGSDRTFCVWCHKAGNPHAPGGEDPDRIRWCENCHGYESLHNIQVDSDAGGQVDTDGDGVLDTDNLGNVVVGAENPWYGHIGNNDDCLGCHGASSSSSAPGTGYIVPHISSSDVVIMTAGTDRTVNLTGTAFTNIVGTFLVTSDVKLTASDGSSVMLTPDSITSSAMTVTIPGTTAVGNYDLKAVKETAESNPVVISVIPGVTITDVYCNKKKGMLTVTGSGFGEKPGGTDGDLNLQVAGQTVELISWTDTQIRASVDRCSKRAAVTVNALFGSTTDGKPCKGKKCR